MKMKFLILFVLAFIAFPALSQKVASKAYNTMLTDLLAHTVKEITVSEIDVNDESITYLDARERKEYEVSHIKNAIWIGYDDFSMSRLKEISKETKIVVYCSVGYRSEKVSEKIIKAGYSNLSNLYGSIFEWVNDGRPVYNMDGDVTNRVHAYNDEWGRWLKKGEKVYE